jgi:predicted nucleic acid-binding protein
METKNKHHQNLVITDASGIISMVVETDTNHAAAKAFAEHHRNTGAAFFVPGELLAETLNLIGKKFSRGLAIDTGKLLLAEPSFVIGTTHGDRHAQALELFKSTPAGVSYTDCLVMVTADEHKTPYVFGFDDIFRKRGYTVPGSRSKTAA